MLAFYFNYHKLIPKYYASKKYVIYGLTNFVLTLFSVLVIDFFIRLSYYIAHLNRDHSYPLNTIFNFRHFDIESLEVIFNHMMPIILAIFISFLFYYFSEKKKREKKETLLVKAEKDFLISQINPHFLFNTLNNIYTLSLASDNKSPKAIMQLSKMLDYSLYGSKKEKVSLKEEIQYINNFIGLFKLKDDNIKSVSFNFSKANNTLKIAPMLLIPFIENAFKHGNIEDTKSGYITIMLKTKLDNKVLFTVKNSYRTKKSVDNSSGIGINNVKRRLELLYFNKHTLSIEESQNEYLIYLTLEI